MKVILKPVIGSAAVILALAISAPAAAQSRSADSLPRAQAVATPQRSPERPAGLQNVIDRRLLGIINALLQTVGSDSWLVHRVNPD